MASASLLNKNWKDLIKPAKLDIKPVSNDSKRATVVAEPLERGFGITLGVALRRTLQWFDPSIFCEFFRI